MEIENIIDEVYEINMRECNIPLSKKQVANVAKKLLEYPIKDEDNYRLALEYAVKMRSIIILYSQHINNTYNKAFNYFNNIKYPIERVLVSMNILNEDAIYNPSYRDKNIISLLNNVDSIDFELKEIIRDKEIKVLI